MLDKNELMRSNFKCCDVFIVSICVERQDDGNVVQISVSKDEEWWQPPQSNPFLMTSTNASSNVSANGDLLQKNNSSEGALEENIHNEKIVL